MCQKLEVQVAMNKPKSDSMLKTEGWKSINWRKVERYVFKLQKRIYAASRCGESCVKTIVVKDVSTVVWVFWFQKA
ncbi:reverse transcriptase N-terminal domain-containing protein [Nostoc sp. UHCC 0702]|nr:reverse transcriptase N-terminal domain-containing protein [Nostoc sp. UHCC 0702]